MSCEIFKCIFCQSTERVGFLIFGKIGQMENACDIIEQHFWFDLKPSELMNPYTCFDCWPKIKSFHEFYTMVEKIHEKELIDADNENEDDCFDKPHNSMDDNLSETASYICAEKVIGLQIDVLHNGDDENDEDQDDDDSHTAVDGDTEMSAAESSSELSIEQSEASSVESRPESRVEIRMESTVESRAQHKIESNPQWDPNSDLEQSEDASELGISNYSNQNGDYENTNECIEYNECYDSSDHTNQSEFNIIQNKYCPEISVQTNGTSERRKNLSQLKHLECYVCHKKYKSIVYLRKHLRKHQDETILASCSVCGMRLNKSSLYGHMKRIHNEEPQEFKCEICDKFFVCANNLSQHRVIHSDVNLTKKQCNICGKWLKNDHCLRAHVLIHQKTVEKCPYCNKTKLGKRALLSHIATAHAEPRHMCRFCGKAFTRPQKLKDHIATHTGVGLHNCRYCSRTFKSNSNMYKHFRDTHGLQWKKDQAKESKLRAKIYT